MSSSVLFVDGKDIKDISCYTPPSPVVLVSTLSKKNVRNLAPISSLSVCSYEPPMLLFAMQRDSDTVKNIIEISDFVIGIPDENIMDKIFTCSQSIPAIDDEFLYANLTPVKSNYIKSYGVGECYINLECKIEWTRISGDHFVICGQVVFAKIKERAVNVNLHELGEFREKIDLISHIYDNKFGIGYNKIITMSD